MSGRRRHSKLPARRLRSHSNSLNYNEFPDSEAETTTSRLPSGESENEDYQPSRRGLKHGRTRRTAKVPERLIDGEGPGCPVLPYSIKTEPGVFEASDVEDHYSSFIPPRPTRSRPEPFSDFPGKKTRPVASTTSIPVAKVSRAHLEETSPSTTPIKERLRKRSHWNRSGNSPSCSDDGYRSRVIGTRYPKRGNRPAPGSLAFPSLDLTSSAEFSDSDEPPKKKRVNLPQKATGGPSCVDALTFEPTIYFPLQETSFETVGGYLPIKEELRRSVIIPFRQRIQVMEMNKRDGTNKTVDMTKGALFWGPPGTGKTLMAKALAYECGRDLERSLPVYIISGAELLTKWVGESESHLREIFHHASENSPSIIFMDELDGLVRKRTNSENDSVNFNMVSTLLTLLNGVMDRGNVLAIATTNFKEVLDPALLRSGRFDIKIHFPPPVESERALILQALTQKWNNKLNGTTSYTLARNTAGFTGADLDLLCKKAKNIACQRHIEPESDNIPLEMEHDVLLSDFFSAWQEVEPCGQSMSHLPYEPLSPLLQPLLQRQLDLLWNGIISSYSVRVGSYMPMASPLETAAWAAFCQPGLLFDFGPVVFIHSDEDPLLLDLLVQALFHNLSERNTVKTVDCRSVLCTNKTVTGELHSMIQDRSAILGLLRIDLLCVQKGEKLQLFDVVRDVLERRDKLRCPLLVITSVKPLSAYGKGFRKLLGSRCKKIQLTEVNQDDCYSFFQDMFLNEALRTAREDGQMMDIVESGARDKTKTLLNQMAKVLVGQSVEVVLTQHQRLSIALNQDRSNTRKPFFLEEIDNILTEFKDRSKLGSSECSISSRSGSAEMA